MKKRLYSVFLLTLFTLGAANITNAQVTIGSLNSPNATLDVVTNNTDVADGVLVPRLTGDQLASKNADYGVSQNGVLVFVEVAATSPAGKTINVDAPGFYYYDAYYDSEAGIWVPLAGGQSPQPTKPEWFYLPPSLIDVTEEPSKTPIDLFEMYKGSITSGLISSASSESFSDFCPVGIATDYYYYIVGYDKNLFDNIVIDEYGIMDYEIKASASPESYINIVLVRK